MKTACKVILVLLYYKYLFGTLIISDNGLSLLNENIFQTLPFYLDPPVYWYLGYLSDPPPPPPPPTHPYYLELESILISGWNEHSLGSGGE